MAPNPRTCFLLDASEKQDLIESKDPILGCLGFTLPTVTASLLESLFAFPTSDEKADLRQNWFDASFDEPGSDRSGEYNPSDDEKELRIYWEELDQILFDGKLYHPRFQLKMKFKAETVSVEEWEESRDGMEGRTSLWQETYGYLPNDIQICVTIWELPNIQDPHKRMLVYLGTLVHEMIHAYFMFYCCKCAACRPNCRSHNQEGVTGHGMTWQRVALALEKFCTDFLKIEICLDRHHAFALETYKSEIPIDKQVCRDLGLDAEYIEEMLTKLESGELEFCENYEI